MAVTIEDAVEHLNLDPVEDPAELALYVAAANEWVDGRVGRVGFLSAADAAARPNVVKVATLFLVEHMWQSQRGPAASPLAGDEIVTVTGVGYAIPNRVLELLQDKATATAGAAAAAFSFPDASAWPDPVEWV